MRSHHVHFGKLVEICTFLITPALLMCARYFNFECSVFDVLCLAGFMPSTQGCRKLTLLQYLHKTCSILGNTSGALAATHLGEPYQVAEDSSAKVKKNIQLAVFLI